jgi:hypothetical protein
MHAVQGLKFIHPCGQIGVPAHLSEGNEFRRRGAASIVPELDIQR